MAVTHSLVGIVGAGTMGAGIAQVAALAGHRTIVFDPSSDALARGQASVAKGLANAAKRGSISQAASEEAIGRLLWTTDLAQIAGAGVIIEAIVERLDAKQALFASIAEIVDKDTVLASNTSSLSINAVAAQVPSPERVIGLHFFNPVPIMQLVEIVPGDRTAAPVRDAMLQLMQAWGKRPVEVRDVPGFIVNRVARPLYAEAFIALGEGISPELIDQALTSCGGFRMGPLALTDLIGHDVNYAVARSVFEAYAGKTRFRPQPAQSRLVEEGRLGRKAGKGVFDYSSELPRAQIAPPARVPSSIKVSASGGTSVKLFRDAGLVVHDSAALPHGFVEVDGVRLVMTDGRRLADRGDAEVLADIARDFAIANTIVLTATDDAAAAAVAGLIQATGRTARRGNRRCDVPAIGAAGGSIVSDADARPIAGLLRARETLAIGALSSTMPDKVTRASPPRSPISSSMAMATDRILPRTFTNRWRFDLERGRPWLKHSSATRYGHPSGATVALSPRYARTTSPPFLSQRFASAIPASSGRRSTT